MSAAENARASAAAGWSSLQSPAQIHGRAHRCAGGWFAGLWQGCREEFSITIRLVERVTPCAPSSTIANSTMARLNFRRLRLIGFNGVKPKPIRRIALSRLVQRGEFTSRMTSIGERGRHFRAWRSGPARCATAPGRPDSRIPAWRAQGSATRKTAGADVVEHS